MKKNWSEFISKKIVLSLTIGFIITFILSKILNPLLEFLYAKFLDLGGFVINSIADSTYRKISNGFCEQGSMFIAFIMYMAACILVSYTLTFIRDSYIDHLKALDDTDEKISKLLNPNEDTEIIENETNIESACQELLRESSDIRTTAKRRYIILSGLLLFLFLVFIFLYAKTVYINEAITKTTNNIEIVSPYISDLEYRQLKSNFHSMQNKSDYEQLHAKLDSIAEQNSLTLKK